MAADGLITIKSSYGPEETMNRLEAEVRSRRMTVFAHIDHAAGAAAVGLSLRPTELLIFGDARAGTPLMQSNQIAGIDLPLKVLVWQDASGIAWLTYQVTGPELLQNPIMWLFILAPLVLVFFISARINTLSVATARWLFFAYAALVGVSLSILFHIYTKSSITRVFFITAATFGALSLFGYTTRRDLSALARVSFWALIALIVFGIVLIFVHIPHGELIYSVLGLVVFAGLTMFDFQRLRRSKDLDSAPLLAASIFLDALNVFLFFLRIFGRNN